MRLLVVEDDKTLREGISEYLAEFGYTVIEAKDGREAISKFNPGYSDSFCKWIRCIKRNQEEKQGTSFDFNSI